MKLVLLPHHNTLTSLQKLQKTVSLHTRHYDAAADMQKSRSSADREACMFLPFYPLVCELGSLDAPEGKMQQHAMNTLKRALTEAEGICSFRTPVREPAATGTSAGTSSDRLILPLEVPFMEKISAAGFKTESALHFTLGSWQYQTADNSSISVLKALPTEEIPPSFRAFRLALMQTIPLSGTDSLSETEQAASFSWKFILPFWVKLH